VSDDAHALAPRLAISIVLIMLCVVTLHLDRRVANVVTRLQVARDECQNFVVVDVRQDADMAREECFAHGDGPDVQLVHRDHAGQLLEASFHFPSIHLPRRALHEDREDVAQHLDGGEQHEHREQERADEVNHFPLGVIPNRRSTQHHADALDEVAEHVEVCTFDVDVALLAPSVRRGRLGAQARFVRTLGLTFVGSMFHMLLFVCTRLVPSTLLDFKIDGIVSGSFSLIGGALLDLVGMWFGEDQTS
jgi:hypothetical protein